MHSFIKLAATGLVVQATIANAHAAVIYINAAAPGGGDGTSWKTAFNDLQDGLAAATPGSGDQLWLVAGIYKPAGPGGDRAISFNLVSGTAIYGGFNGTETRLEQRDPTANVTILSGDLNGDDVGAPDDPTHLENSYHVVRAANTAKGTVLDGCKIVAGCANVTPGIDGNGGGLGLSASVVQIVGCEIAANYAIISGGGVYNQSSATFVACRFESNISGRFGGGLSSSGSGHLILNGCEFINNQTRTSPGNGGGALLQSATYEVTDCLFEGNTAGFSGGGMECTVGTGTVTACRFVNNTATEYGPGGLGVYQSMNVIDCQFINNHAAITGGGTSFLNGPTSMINCLFVGNSSYYAGAAYLQDANVEFVNCVMTGNSVANVAGAVYVTGHASLDNCTIAGNTAHEEGGAVYRTDVNSAVDLTNSILWNNTDASGNGETSQIFGGPGSGSITFSTVQGWTGTLGDGSNNGVDPLFVDADGPDNTPGTEDDNLRLTAASLAIDNGDPATAPAHPTDIDGQPREVACIVDRGAYESSDSNPVEPDCNNNGVQDSCDIDSQFSTDCNFNRVPDDCDIASQLSADLDANGVPDECQGVPTNNLCGGAKVAFSGNNIFTNVHATTDGPSEPAGCGFSGGDGQLHNDVWFRYPAQCSGIVTINLCGANFDARLAVYVGCPSQPGQMIACSDNDCGTSPRVSFNNTTTTIYRVRIGGASAGTPGMGGGNMVITCTPSPQCAGDANGNGTVNIEDLLLVIGNWGQAGISPADVNGDSIVNIADLLAVIAGWGSCA